ncbi:MAG TPA: SRPBCC family protein [Caulobacteraceae bacterium]|nr:SRPBCC family protein [Caulobacteraceae bacterium]
MHSTRVTRILPYRPEQLFDLIADVEAYPQFLPWVTSLRAWNRADLGEGMRSLDAEAKVGFAIVRETFGTRVKLDERGRTIEVGLLYGPFKRLRNLWRFVEDGKGTRVEFEIDFEFKSRLLDALLAANLRHAAERLIGCFEARARRLYGASASSSPATAGGAA